MTLYSWQRNKLGGKIEFKKVIFDFNMKGAKGLKGIYYGKGGTGSFLAFIIIIVCFVAFLAIPFNLELGSLIPKFIFLFFCFLVIHQYYRQLLEIIVDKDTIQFRIYKKYKEFLIPEIQLIKMYYSSMNGTASIIIKTKSRSNRFSLYLWSFSDEEKRRRYELFLKLAQTIIERSEGRFEVKHNLKKRIKKAFPGRVKI